MRKIILCLLVLIVMFMAVGCGNEKEKSSKKESDLKVGIVLSVGGLGDKSYNDSAYRGLQMAAKSLNIEYKYVEPSSAAEDEGFLREFAEADYDLVIGTGFLMKDAVTMVAKDFPDIKFAIIDEVVDLPNVASLVFKEAEGSFLVGALAAMMSETDRIGFVGGMEIPLIQKFQRGYEMGAKYINPDVKVDVLYTPGESPFNDPVRGKENALALAGQGSDVIYHAAGGTGVGVIGGAKQAGVYAIGVDSNQDELAKGVVLTSMVKKVDIAVLTVIGELSRGRFMNGVNEFGVAEDGVGTTKFEFTKEIIGEEKIAKLDGLKKDIIAKKIKF